VTEPASRAARVAGLVAVALGAAFVLYTAQVAALHCDETNVLRHSTRFARGDFAHPGRPGLLWLLLAPLTWLRNPVWITTAHRLVAALASAATLWGVLAVAGTGGADPDRRSATERAWGGAFAVALLATSLCWQGHAFEVRTDTFVAPLVLAAMLQLWRPDVDLKRAALAGGLIAATALFSQKSIYNAGALAAGWGVYVLASGRPFQLKGRLLQGLVVTGVVGVIVGGWFGLLALVSGGGTVTHTFEVATRTAFSLQDFGWDKKIEQLEIGFQRGPVVWVLCALGLPWAVVGARRWPRAAAVATVAAVMLGTIAIHRGFRTYYVASLQPYFAIVAGGGLAWIVTKLRYKAAFVLPALAVATAVWFGAPLAGALVQTSNAHQIGVMREAHDAFPESVPYMDLLALVPGYDEITFLGTGPQRTLFRKRSSDRNRAFILHARERKPRFFIADYMSREGYFTKTESRWLWRHFLPYRPNFYLHGARMQVRAEAGEQSVELLVDGEYTVWFLGGWSGEASLDGTPLEHGTTIPLTAGAHTLRGATSTGDGELWVLLGADREPADEDPRDHVDWSMFPRDRRDRYQRYDRRRRKDVADLLTPLWDPTVTEAGHEARKRRHRKYQVKRTERFASP